MKPVLFTNSRQKKISSKTVEEVAADANTERGRKK
jgi:hypothetical protein